MKADIVGGDHPQSIACIGEAMVEVTLGHPGVEAAKIVFAGDTLNTAIHLKRNNKIVAPLRAAISNLVPLAK